MSRSHRLCDRATFFWPCAKSWDLYAQVQHSGMLTSFYSFFFMIHTYYVILVWFLLFFLRKISNLKFWPRKKSTFIMSVLILLFKEINLWPEFTSPPHFRIQEGLPPHTGQMNKRNPKCLILVKWHNVNHINLFVWRNLGS